MSFCSCFVAHRKFELPPLSSVYPYLHDGEWALVVLAEIEKIFQMKKPMIITVMQPIGLN